MSNWAFGDPAASWEEILMIFVANLQMLNSVKLSFFRHPVDCHPIIHRVRLLQVECLFAYKGHLILGFPHKIRHNNKVYRLSRNGPLADLKMVIFNILSYKIYIRISVISWPFEGVMQWWNIKKYHTKSIKCQWK